MNASHGFEHFKPEPSLSTARRKTQLPQTLTYSEDVVKTSREFADIYGYDEDDPLETWHQYIKYAEKKFPTERKKNGLQKLLQICLQEFKDAAEYYQDVRLVKLWLKYIELVENPLHIFSQLSMHGIGVQSALFYKSWADELLKSGNKKQADKVFCEGLKRRAQPIRKLQAAYENFQIAVARSVLDASAVDTINGCDTKNGSSHSESVVGCPSMFGVLKSVQNLPYMVGGNLTKSSENIENIHPSGKVLPKYGTLYAKKIPEGNHSENIQLNHNFPSAKKPDVLKLKIDNFHCPVAIFEVPNPCQRIMYPKEKVYADNTEYSLEELRAAHYIKPKTTTGGLSKQEIRICEEQSCRNREISRLPLTSVNKDLARVQEPLLTHHHSSSMATAKETARVQEPLLTHHHSSSMATAKETARVQEPLLTHHHSSSTATAQETARGSSTSSCSKTEKQSLDSNHSPHLCANSSKVSTVQKELRREDCTEEKVDRNVSLRKRGAISSKKQLVKSLVEVRSGTARINKITANNTSIPDILEVNMSKTRKYTLNNTVNCNNNSRAYKTITEKHASVVAQTSVGHVTAQSIVKTEQCEHVSNAKLLHKESEHSKDNLQVADGDNNMVQDSKCNDIPFVPSPGMTAEEIENLKGTENKENEGVPGHNIKNEVPPVPVKPPMQCRPVGLDHNDAGAVNAERFSTRGCGELSDTCSSQMFAHTLLSSTPFRKSLFSSSPKKRMIRNVQTPAARGMSEEMKLKSLSENLRTPFVDLIDESPSNPKSNRVSAECLQVEICTEINPFDDNLIKQLLHNTQFVEKNEGRWLHIIRKPMPRMKLSSKVKIGDETYNIIKEIGRGSYARILYATKNESRKLALKIQKPPWLWEPYIEEQIQRRLKDKTVCECFASPIMFYKYIDGSILVNEFLTYGSVLKFITETRRLNRSINENVILCFVTKIIEVLQKLHGDCNIIHGDVKPDNIMIKSVVPPVVQLIDFGRAIDMTLFPSGTSFTYVVTTKDFQCIEMQTNRPWTYQTDLYGLASTAHCFLFGEYMKVVQKKGIWCIQKAIPRSYKKHLWSQFFHELLNIESCDKLPNLRYWEETLLKEINTSLLNDQLTAIKNFLDGH